jgi:hypothetical protein
MSTIHWPDYFISISRLWLVITPPPSLRSSHPVGYKLLATKLETACKPLACTYESTRHHNPEEHPHLHFECSASCFHYTICSLDSWHFIWLTNALSVCNATRMFSVFRRACNWTPPWGTSFTSSQHSCLYNVYILYYLLYASGLQTFLITHPYSSKNTYHEPQYKAIYL